MDCRPGFHCALQWRPCLHCPKLPKNGPRGSSRCHFPAYSILGTLCFCTYSKRFLTLTPTCPSRSLKRFPQSLSDRGNNLGHSQVTVGGVRGVASPALREGI